MTQIRASGWGGEAPAGAGPEEGCGEAGVAVAVRVQMGNKDSETYFDCRKLCYCAFVHSGSVRDL